MRYFDARLYDAAGIANNQHVLKEQNLRDVFSIIHHNQGVSRIQVSKMTGLTPTTITSLVDELLLAGLICEAGQALSNSAGRRPIMLRTDPKGMQIPVFSFHTDGIEYRLYDLEYNELEADFVHFPAVPEPDLTLPHEHVSYQETDGLMYTDIMCRIVQERSRCIDMKKVNAMCIVIPGTIEWNINRFSSGVMHVCGSTNFLSVFRDRLGGVPLLVGNVADCFGYAQYTAMRDQTKDMVFLYVGYGVGAGAIINGEVYTGMNYLAAEFGHISINFNGPRCFCGNRGCIERYAGQPAIISRVRQAVREANDHNLLDRVGGDIENLTWEAVCAAYREGDPLVRDLIDNNVVRELSAAISNLTTILDISRMIIGGGVEELGEDFLNRLRKEFNSIGYAKAMRRLNISFPDAEAGEACLGAAKRFVDRYFMICVDK